MEKIIIGSRGSELSLKQTEIIKQQLLSLQPHLAVEIKVITTKGDKNKNPIPLDTVGKGWFTKELDKALFNGDIDLAVHSMKDLPEVLPKGLIIGAISKREDARDVLITKNNISLKKLKKHAVIGTDSTRRKIQILKLRNDLVVQSIRGNVPPRIAKLDAGQYDGIILAAAGLKRLGLADRITQYLEPSTYVPSPGQGALAVVIRKSDKMLYDLLQSINDEQTTFAVTAERAFSRVIGGGCKMPVGAYAIYKKNSLMLYGMFGSIDGSQVIIKNIQGKASDAALLGENLAKSFLVNISNTVVITRSVNDNKDFKKKLEKIGIKVFEHPSIAISDNALDTDEYGELSSIEKYDWFIFTSAKGVIYFMQTLKQQGIDKNILLKKKIAVVGPQTAKAVKKYDLPVDFTPSIFTTKQLAKEIKNVTNKKILLPRSDIASVFLTKALHARGAQVTNIPIYKTVSAFPPTKDFYDLVQRVSIRYITFTSPSTVRGFIESIGKSDIRKVVKDIPVLSIGPVTAKEAQRKGFSNITVVDPHTIDAIVEFLRRKQ